MARHAIRPGRRGAPASGSPSGAAGRRRTRQFGLQPASLGAGNPGPSEASTHRSAPLRWASPRRRGRCGLDELGARLGSRPPAEARSFARPKRMRLLTVPSGHADAPGNLLGRHPPHRRAPGPRAAARAGREGPREPRRPDAATTCVDGSASADGSGATLRGDHHAVLSSGRCLTLAPEVERPRARHQPQVRTEFAARGIEPARPPPHAARRRRCVTSSARTGPS